MTRKETFESLMPVINPNLDEIVVEGRNEPLKLEKPKEKEIFQRKEKKGRATIDKKKLGERRNLPQNDPNTEPRKEFPPRKNSMEETTDIEQIVAPPPKKKRNYDHLKKARAKALIVRKEKAEARRVLREQEKEEKETLKLEKKKLRTEKNRSRARENYYKKKDLKKEKIESQEIKQEIEKIENNEVKKQLTTVVNNGSMDYGTFSNFMKKYEQEKSIMKKQRNVKVERKQSIPIPIPKKSTHQSKHPPNYYNPNDRRRQSVDSLFRL